jgi:hypothetical protein
MTAKIRKLNKQFTSTHKTKFKNLLVSGCSFVFNNSDKYICCWPYYLRDHAGFEEVYDCSQSGAGNNHIFNSTINEIETNNNIDNNNTLVIIMWSGLTRTDVVAERSITQPWHHMSNYNFDDQYATLTIFNSVNGSTQLDQLCQQYKKLVSVDAQVYESLLKIIALKTYLDQKGFKSVITSWKDPRLELKKTTISQTIIDSSLSSLNKIEYLDSYATLKNLKETDGHPNPNGYLAWTREHLLPYLESTNFVTKL